MQSPQVPPQFSNLYSEGERLQADIVLNFASWPRQESQALRDEALPDDVASRIEELRERAHVWFNTLSVQVLPFTAFGRTHLSQLLRRLAAAIAGREFREQHTRPGFRFMGLDQPDQIDSNVEIDQPVETAEVEAATAMREALRLVRSAYVPAGVGLGATTTAPTAAYVPNSVFVLMWMDRSRPELVDVHQAVKEVCSEYGVHARRADDVEHQERITDVILHEIASSEFIVADLTGERPNVYYEVGFAHAIGKRPILLRRAGTPLHFDIAGYNVPEYANLTELKELLRRRLSHMTGRTGRTAGA